MHGVISKFSAPTPLVTSIASSEHTASRPDARIDQVRQAEDELRSPGQQIMAEHHTHDNRTGSERYRFIADTPGLSV
jgi:hypothetical protein